MSVDLNFVVGGPCLLCGRQSHAGECEKRVISPAESEAVHQAMRAAAEGARNFSGWKLGDEFLPFHPQASHIGPDYRDGWNACFEAARALLAGQQAVAVQAEVAVDQPNSKDRP